MQRLLSPALIVGTSAAFLGIGLLLATLGNLQDSTRSSADLSALRADAAGVALLAEEAVQRRDTTALEAAIVEIEQRSAVVPNVAAESLTPDEAAPLLAGIQDGWQQLATTARLRADGRATIDDLIESAALTEARVDALLDAVADANESRLDLVANVLRAAVVTGVVLLVFLAALVTRSVRRHLSEFDPGTGLPRERRMQRILRDQLRSKDGASVLSVGLDNFDRARGALGGSAADLLLAEVATLLGRTLPVQHSIGRAGDGDLLVVVSGQATPARHAANAIVQILDQPHSFQGFELRVTASVGVAISGVDGDDVDALLHAADAAQTQARNLGGARFALYDPSEVLQDPTEVLALEAELRHSLDEERFRLYYQPQVSLRDGRLIGAEALLRWESPQRGGLVSPGVFIPILEATDLIVPVGDWVIRTAVEEVARWPSVAGQPLRVAVNASGHQLDEGLIGRVDEALVAHGVPAAQLEIEVTETAALRRPEAARAVLQSLRDRGIHTALDDFGTGQSSLEQIKALPGDSIKIDRAFVIDVVDDRADRSIVEAVVSIAESLGRSTVAEGIETVEQFLALRDLGCDIAQGYLVARPMPAEEFREFIETWTTPDWLQAAQSATPAPATDRAPAPAAPTVAA